MTDQELRFSRWLRALTIAKILFEDQGYHTVYLEEIEELIQNISVVPATPCPGVRHTMRGGTEQ